MTRFGRPNAARTLFGLVVAVVATLGGLAVAQAASRLALVIGNDTYQRISKLKNPVADVRLMEGKLRQVGFEVDLVTDGTKTTLARAIRDFGRKVAAAGPGATVLLYYAGHGVQDDKQTNYLIPVDADLQVQADLATEGIAIDTIVRLLDQSNVKVGIVVLDACRDNPLPNRTRSAKRGLAVEERAGLYIAFSTEPGQVALDGEGQNSPYAEALAAEITVPGVEIEKMFKNVRRRVYEASGNKQLPWESTRLTEEVYLGGPPVTPVAVQRVDPVPQPATPSQTTVSPAPPPVADPNIEYARAVREDTAEGYEKLLQQFPNHPKKDLIIALVQRKAEEGLWKEAEAVRGRAQESAVLERLLTAFERGIYADRARDRLAAIQKEAEAKRAPAPAELSDTAQRDFETAKRANTIEAWNGFLAANPNGSLATLARYNLALLTSAQAAAAIPAVRQEPVSLPVRAPTAQYHYVSGLDPNGDNWLALRSAPSFSAPWSQTRMGPGQLVTVKGSSGEWLNVELPSGETGWASGRFIACCRTADAAAAAASSFAATAAITANRPVAPVAPIASGAQYHYVSGLDPNGDNWLALRSAPSLKAPWSKTRMGPGTLLKVFGTSGDFYQVQLQSGETGWAARRYVVCCRTQ